MAINDERAIRIEKAKATHIDVTSMSSKDTLEMVDFLRNNLGFISFGFLSENTKVVSIKEKEKCFLFDKSEKDSVASFEDWKLKYFNSKAKQEKETIEEVEENSGGSVDYYKVKVENPTTPDLHNSDEVWAECNDIIESLDMTYAEANIFKEIWRSAAARTLGKKKAGHTDKRGAEKIVFFADRNFIQKVKDNG